MNIDDEEKVDSIKNIDNSLKENKLLCSHCKRTKDNGISCIGMCVADNDY